MNYKHKILLLLSIIFISVYTYAQVGSPYSQYGFGDNQNKGFEQSKAMGGIGIGLRMGNQLNNINPASYSRIDSLSVIYAIGVNTGYNRIETSADKMTRTDTKFGYFALGFKGNSFWGSSFGLAPVTSVDYRYKYTEKNDVNGDVNYYVNGTGGLNEVYWGNSFLVTPNLSLGINASFIFGAIDKVATAIFSNDASYMDNTKAQQTRNVNDIKFNYGIQYELELDKKSKFILGAVFENKMKLNSKMSYLGGTVAYSEDADFYGDIYEGELKTVAVDTSDIKSDITLPNAFGFGVTYMYNNKIIAGVDITKQDWSSLDNTLYNAAYRNSYSFKGGLEYTPDYNSVNHYLYRIRYRFGAHYSLSQLEIRNTRINDYGLSMGIGLPMRSTQTTFNLAVEVGQRGTLEQNLLRETYGIISLNISLSDIWFLKRKIK